MTYTIKVTAYFEKKFYKMIPKQLQEQAWRRIERLSQNPYVGKPLRYEFIRELKLEKFRIYFIIYKEDVTIVMADISDKKHQKGTINNIIEQFIKNLNSKRLP